MTTIQLDNISAGTAPVVTVSIGEESFIGKVARVYLFPVPDTTGDVSLAGNYDEYVPPVAGGVFTRTLNRDSGTDEPGYILTAGAYRIVLQNNSDGIIAGTETFTVGEPISKGGIMVGADLKHVVGIRIDDNDTFAFEDKHSLVLAIGNLKAAKKALQDEQLAMIPVMNDADGKINLYSTDGNHTILSADKAKYSAALVNAVAVLDNALASLQTLNLQP